MKLTMCMMMAVAGLAAAACDDPSFPSAGHPVNAAELEAKLQDWGATSSFDQNQDRQLSPEEFSAAAAALDLQNLLPSEALGEEPGSVPLTQPEVRSSEEQSYDRLFKALDHDGDGQLNGSEVARGALSVLDRNHDGLFDATERNQWQEQLGERGQDLEARWRQMTPEAADDTPTSLGW